MTTYGISGHQKAPLSVWNLLTARLPEILGDPPFVAVSSLAAGADQRFAEDVVARGGALHVVLPSSNYESSFDHPDDLDRYKTLLSRASRVETLDFAEPAESAYLAAGQRVVDLCDVLVAVWDGLPAQGKGGTADIVSYARSIGKMVNVIWPTGVRR
ncbi:hypothetical protein CH298_27065 [Rhodococcoides fascians]|uniref:hypothetical protein n=1 Tax=Rhodococcoides fascians TaxID=1828 RepID=UPI000B9B902B|nr:hypothetical protein [Rhodococcus fascians]OZE81418.1 hypothetical protein CH303_27605 [Rhodococcus fascians]OZF10242.1 hypothetical protein CH298_27065 [Rhodococcus fascians]OZF13332.1 hypothetical protein CH297_27355 [Rhodococcus fascians]OZF59430.1 hypothetical protein CH308_27805 [Rhodococcus fascians]OZF60545.1 hypothetical protein CH307_27990 [Rhodococcus fascians]